MNKKAAAVRKVYVTKRNNTQNIMEIHTRPKSSLNFFFLIHVYDPNTLKSEKKVLLCDDEDQELILEKRVKKKLLLELI